MNTPAQCGVIKPPKTDIYSEAPQTDAPKGGVVEVPAGFVYSCGVQVGATVVCWGSYDNGVPDESFDLFG